MKKHNSKKDLIGLQWNNAHFFIQTDEEGRQIENNNKLTLTWLLALRDFFRFRIFNGKYHGKIPKHIVNN